MVTCREIACVQGNIFEPWHSGVQGNIFEPWHSGKHAALVTVLKRCDRVGTGSGWGRGRPGVVRVSGCPREPYVYVRACVSPPETRPDDV